MPYRSVANRCAVDLSEFKLPVPDEVALRLLKQLGFKVLDVDMIALARSRLGRTQHVRGARQRWAPERVDCSTYVRWVYGQRGIWLDRLSVQQRRTGTPVELFELEPGDLIFTTSTAVNWFDEDPEDNVGHVVMATEPDTVIRSSNKFGGVKESPLSVLFERVEFRGARRYIPKDRQILTLETPEEFDIEQSDDLRWLLLKKLATLGIFHEGELPLDFDAVAA